MTTVDETCRRDVGSLEHVSCTCITVASKAEHAGAHTHRPGLHPALGPKWLDLIF